MLGNDNSDKSDEYIDKSCNMKNGYEKISCLLKKYHQLNPDMEDILPHVKDIKRKLNDILIERIDKSDIMLSNLFTKIQIIINQYMNKFNSLHPFFKEEFHGMIFNLKFIKFSSKSRLYC